jgi:hypothetical protein
MPKSLQFCSGCPSQLERGNQAAVASLTLAFHCHDIAYDKAPATELRSQIGTLRSHVMDAQAMLSNLIHW